MKNSGVNKEIMMDSDILRAKLKVSDPIFIN